MEKKKCKVCKENKLINEYYKNGNSYHSYCKKCNIKNTIKRQQENKIKYLDYKGTRKCIICGYNKCTRALDFHHLDPSKKEYSIRDLRLRSLNEDVKKELDKCVVVCSNCHAEIHDGLVDPYEYI